MRPWQHARASARRTGRSWRDDLPIHELVDASKVALPDLRHRLVLHSADLGPELVARAFPERPEARDVARRHAREDLGADIPARVWIELLDEARLPRLRTLALDSIVDDERRRAKLRDADGPRAVCEILASPLTLAPDEPRRALCLLAHGFGVELVRRILGPPREVPGVGSADVMFDPAFCAEGILVRLFRRIPDLREIASALRPEHRLALEALATRAMKEAS